MSDFLIDINGFSQGLQLLEDTTDAPVGSARIMTNCMVTDRGGISPRPGTSIIGTFDSGTTGCDGFYTYQKSGVVTEIPIKASNGIIKYYHPILLDWAMLMNGYTAGKEFGFKEHLINTDNEDYLYFCNAQEYYSRWPGSYASTVGALTGSETTLTVDSNLKTTTYESGTATGSSSTTITDNSKSWASSQWIGFYIQITSGAGNHKIALISGNTSNQLTFSTLGSDPSSPTYSIRMPKFSASGTLMVNGSQVAYSAIPTDTTFTITAPAVAIPNNSPVTVIPTTYTGAPRGNRLENHHTRMIVGNVQSGMSRDSSGTLQGSQSTASIYVSKIKNASDFTFASPRIAGEGDIITAAYGGGNITDVVNFEDSFAIFKKYYIELDKYSTTDSADIPASTPLKQGFGSINHAIKARDDVYFVTADKQITSLSRVLLKDTVPQTINIGLIIKRLIDTFDFTSVVGHEYKQRILFACKQSAGDTANNQIIVYNRENKSWEGIWYLNASQFDIFNGNIYAADSTSPNVYQLFTGYNDLRTSTQRFGVDASWRSNWIHLVPRRSRFRVKPTQFSIQGINSLGFQGYITDGTIITFSLFTDFVDTAQLTFDFGRSSTDENFLQGSELGAFMGNNPLGLEPLGTISDPLPDGSRHFKFVVYFPDIYSNYLSIGVDSSGTDQSWELIRIGLGTSEDSMQSADNIKDIS